MVGVGGIKRDFQYPAVHFDLRPTQPRAAVPHSDDLIQGTRQCASNSSHFSASFSGQPFQTSTPPTLPQAPQTASLPGLHPSPAPTSRENTNPPAGACTT